MTDRFGHHNFTVICNLLACRDEVLEGIINKYGYPPVWKREPDFTTLIHIILEQQVSLASARAALNKLQEMTGGVTPEKLLALSDEQLKACYFSRQKIVYARCLATAVLNGDLNLESFETMTDEEIRQQLKKIKGIGDWTADVFLMMALNRSNLFPVGDIALVNSVRHEMTEPHLSKETILSITSKWQPYRTIAAFLFWHAYIKRKGMVV